MLLQTHPCRGRRPASQPPLGHHSLLQVPETVAHSSFTFPVQPGWGLPHPQEKITLTGTLLGGGRCRQTCTSDSCVLGVLGGPFSALGGAAFLAWRWSQQEAGGRGRRVFSVAARAPEPVMMSIMDRVCHRVPCACRDLLLHTGSAPPLAFPGVQRGHWKMHRLPLSRNPTSGIKHCL